MPVPQTASALNWMMTRPVKAKRARKLPKPMPVRMARSRASAAVAVAGADGEIVALARKVASSPSRANRPRA
jgi:hypothetical protein